MPNSGSAPNQTHEPLLFHALLNTPMHAKVFVYIRHTMEHPMSHHRPSTSYDPDLEVSEDEEDEDDLTFRDMVEQTAMQTDLREMYEENDGL